MLLLTTGITHSLKTSVKNDLYEILEFSEETKINNDASNIFTVLLNFMERKRSNKTIPKFDVVSSKFTKRLSQVLKVNNQVLNTRFKGIQSYYLNSSFDFSSILTKNISDSEASKFAKTLSEQYESQEVGSNNYSFEFKDSPNKPTIYYRLTKLESKIQDAIIQTAKNQLSADEYTLFMDAYNNNTLNKASYMNTIITFSWNDSVNLMVDQILKNMFPFILIGTSISIIAGMILYKYLCTPLKNLKSAVDNIAKRNWNTPLVINREDEIGTLASSIEKMRQDLVQTHEQEQWMLQKVSHELKTPVMIIRSYAQAVRDGIYPKGSLEASIDTIDNEALRLNNKIKDLLYLTKLNYLTKHNLEKTKLDMSKIIEKTALSFVVNHRNIEIDTQISTCEMLGIKDQLTVIIENLLDNAIRYANTKVSVSCFKKDSKIQIQVFNDGDSISDEVLSHIFEPFHKGSKGNYGLGLAIVQNIVQIHNGEISVQNLEDGVSFFISLDDGLRKDDKNE